MRVKMLRLLLACISFLILLAIGCNRGDSTSKLLEVENDNMDNILIVSDRYVLAIEENDEYPYFEAAVIISVPEEYLGKSDAIAVLHFLEHMMNSSSVLLNEYDELLFYLKKNKGRSLSQVGAQGVRLSFRIERNESKKAFEIFSGFFNPDFSLDDIVITRRIIESELLSGFDYFENGDAQGFSIEKEFLPPLLMAGLSDDRHDQLLYLTKSPEEIKSDLIELYDLIISQGMPTVSIINAHEEVDVRELISIFENISEKTPLVDAFKTEILGNLYFPGDSHISSFRVLTRLDCTPIRGGSWIEDELERKVTDILDQTDFGEQFRGSVVQLESDSFGHCYLVSSHQNVSIKDDPYGERYFNRYLSYVYEAVKAALTDIQVDNLHEKYTDLKKENQNQGGLALLLADLYKLKFSNGVEDVVTVPDWQSYLRKTVIYPITGWEQFEQLDKQSIVSLDKHEIVYKHQEYSGNSSTTNETIETVPSHVLELGVPWESKMLSVEEVKPGFTVWHEYKYIFDFGFIRGRTNRTNVVAILSMELKREFANYTTDTSRAIIEGWLCGLNKDVCSLTGISRFQYTLNFEGITAQVHVYGLKVSIVFDGFFNDEQKKNIVKFVYGLGDDRPAGWSALAVGNIGKDSVPQQLRRADIAEKLTASVQLAILRADEPRGMRKLANDEILDGVQVSVLFNEAITRRILSGIYQDNMKVQEENKQKTRKREVLNQELPIEVEIPYKGASKHNLAFISVNKQELSQDELIAFEIIIYYASEYFLYYMRKEGGYTYDAFTRRSCESPDSVGIYLYFDIWDSFSFSEKKEKLLRFIFELSKIESPEFAKLLERFKLGIADQKLNLYSRAHNYVGGCEYIFREDLVSRDMTDVEAWKGAVLNILKNHLHFRMVQGRSSIEK